MGDCDYSKGKIYKLVCETGKVYIGSTTLELYIRLSAHNSKTNKCITKDFINPKIQLIELFPCETKNELLWREREWFDKTDCVNLNRPILTEEERRLLNIERGKIYYTNESIKILERNKIYRNLNRAKLYEVQTQKFTCECGGKYTYTNKSKHGKTEKHLTYLAKTKTDLIKI